MGKVSREHAVKYTAVAKLILEFNIGTYNCGIG